MTSDQLTRRWAMARLMLTGVLHGKFTPAAAWRLWRKFDWTQ